MVINKVYDFIKQLGEAEIEAEKAKIKEYSQKEADILEQALEAVKSQDKEKYNALLALYGQAAKATNDAMRAIEQRYIEAFNGNIEAIIADIREIVNAIEKQDYLSWIKPLTELTELEKGANDKTGSKNKKKNFTRGYKSFCSYLRIKTRVQFNALVFYGEADNEEARAIIDAKAASFYKKPKDAYKAEAETELTIIPIKENEINGSILTLPTSPATNLLYGLISATNLSDLQSGAKEYNRNAKYKISKNGNKRKIEYSAQNSQIVIEIDDILKLANSSPQTKKILTKILMETNRQAIRQGELIKDNICFSLKELVGEGQYKSLKTARQGFSSIGNMLTSIKMSGKLYRGKKAIEQEIIAVLFTGIRIKNSTAEIYLNPRLNWKFITAYFTGLPDFYFQLPDRAAELLYYIFYLARQNSKQIEQEGFFVISFKAIQSRLNLPKENETKNTKRDIKDEIEKAVATIKEKYKSYQTTEEPELELELNCNSKLTIKEYLKSGKLIVKLKGNYAKKFIELSKKTAGQIEARKKREEKIKEKIIAEKALKEENNS